MDRKPKLSPSPAPSPLASPLPSGGNYTDFVLRSTAPSSATGWRYNIMKFAPTGDKSIDPSSSNFLQPVKLNRKDPRTVRRLTEQDRQRIQKRREDQLAGIKTEPDSMQTEGNGDEKGKGGEEELGEADDVDEKEVLDPSRVGVGLSGPKSTVKRAKGGKFQKKIKRVFVSSEEARRLKREEWMPWMLEDDEGNERWIGRLEGGVSEKGQPVNEAGNPANDPTTENGAVDSVNPATTTNGTSTKGWRPAAAPSEAGGGGSCYVAFVFGDKGDEFQVVPVNRWYKFSQAPKYVTLGTEDAETEYEKQQKTDGYERWLMHRRNNPSGMTKPTPTAVSTSTSASAPAAGNIHSRLMGKSAASARKAAQLDKNRSRMNLVDTGRKQEADDDELGNKTQGKSRGGAADQDDDEFDYEEDFQDDEEGIAQIDDLADEEQTKELEERIKREMRAVERLEGDDTALLDEPHEEELTLTGKALRKLMKKTDKTGNLYDSDEDEDEIESQDEDLSDTASMASLDINKNGSTANEKNSTSQRPSHISRENSHQRTHSNSQSRHHSRATSPSGSAYIAKRATSPTGSASGRRSLPQSRNSSPGPSSAKRKRIEGEDETTKRQRNAPPTAGGSAAGDEGSKLITEQDLVALFRLKGGENRALSTAVVLTHFRKLLKANPKNKQNIGNLLQTVANLVNGELVLKSSYE